MARPRSLPSHPPPSEHMQAMRHAHADRSAMFGGVGASRNALKGLVAGQRVPSPLSAVLGAGQSPGARQLRGLVKLCWQRRQLSIVSCLRRCATSEGAGSEQILQLVVFGTNARLPRSPQVLDGAGRTLQLLAPGLHPWKPTRARRRPDTRRALSRSHRTWASPGQGRTDRR